MYLDQYNIVTLEYHYYQENCIYTTLNQCEEHIDDNGVLRDEDGEEVHHELGCESYKVDPHKYPMSSFER